MSRWQLQLHDFQLLCQELPLSFLAISSACGVRCQSHVGLWVDPLLTCTTHTHVSPTTTLSQELAQELTVLDKQQRRVLEEATQEILRKP